MARREVIITIADEGRDKGKVFVITELPASRAEAWAIRAMLALTKSGVDLPENIEGAGMAGIFALGMKALGGLDAADALTLLNELFMCVRHRPNPEKPEIVRNLIEDDIEEVKTRMKLRMEVLELHTGFSVTAALSKLKPTTTAVELS